MRVGVITAMQHSMFSGGVHTLSITIAEAMRALGHTVELINTVASAWWDDCTELAAAWTVVPIGNAKGYDLCIECGPLMLDALRRARIATKSIWVLNTPFLLREIEFSTFPIACERRDFEGIAESWLMMTVTGLTGSTRGQVHQARRVDQWDR